MKKEIIQIKLILILLFLLPTISANNDTNFTGMNIKIELRTHENVSSDFLVMGNTLYYNITLEANEKLVDTINITIINPEGNLIHNAIIPNLDLNKEEKISYIPKIGKNQDIIAVPLDLSGDYQLKICSENNNKFYRKFKSSINDYNEAYVWQQPCINFPFSVIKHYEFKQIKITQGNSEKNQIQTELMIKLTQKLLWFTVILLIFQMITTLSTKEGRKAVFNLILFIPAAIFAFGAYSAFDLYYWTNPHESPILIVAIGFIIMSLIYLIAPLMKLYGKNFLQKKKSA